MIWFQTTPTGELGISGMEHGLVQDVAIELAPSLLALSDDGCLFPFIAELIETDAVTASRRCVRMRFLEEA